MQKFAESISLVRCCIQWPRENKNSYLLEMQGNRTHPKDLFSPEKGNEFQRELIDAGCVDGIGVAFTRERGKQ